MGDFNKILACHEKEGGAYKPAVQIESFEDVLTDCKLSDLAWVGAKFTWCNRHIDDTWTRLHLEKADADSEWRDIFQEACFHTLFSMASGHMPVLVDWASARGRPDREVGRPMSRIFQFNNAWTKEKECRRIISQVWVKKSTVATPLEPNFESLLFKISQIADAVGKEGVQDVLSKSSAD